MTSDRIKEIQQTTAYPESVSVMLALLQVWNECEQDSTKYSEEEVKELLSKFHIVTDGTKKFEEEWFKRFKK